MRRIMTGRGVWLLQMVWWLLMAAVALYLLVGPGGS
jgi:hypothetical protein